MANRFIGGVLSSRPQANTPFSSRASTGTYFDSAGVMRTAPINQPRLNYSLVGSAWTQPTVLIEQASTNILSYSSDLSNGYWTTSDNGINLTSNTIAAPDGTSTGDKIYANTSSSIQHYAYPNGGTAVSAGTYTASIHAKAGEQTRLICGIWGGSDYAMAQFDLANGTILQEADAGMASITSVGNGWYRCTVRRTIGTVTTYFSFGPNINTSLAATTGYFPYYTGDGSSGIYVWGAQQELGITATSYIPTTSAAVTRAADVVGPGTSGIYSLEDRQATTATDDQATVTSFTSTGSTSWTAPADVVSVEVLVVAGGGGGGNAQGGGGGGGAGGLLYNVSYPVTPGTTYPIIVGAGGAGGASGQTAAGTNGQNSQFGALVAIGGGTGSAEYVNGINGRTGGSGGGNCYSTATSGAPGIAGQGYSGGVSSSVNGSGYEAGGGGGGAGGPGANGINTGTAATSVGGNGGPGLYFNISGTNTVYAGGGGGAANSNTSPGISIGGSGIGGGGGRRGGPSGGNGTVNTGSGGGGGGTDSSAGGSGGSGIVVVKYKRTPRQITATSNAAVVVQKFSTTNLWIAPTGVTQVEALVVAGGGGAGGGGGGGGGAGGVVYNSAFAVTPGATYGICVGNGGTGFFGTGSNGASSLVGTGNLVSNGNFTNGTTGWTDPATGAEGTFVAANGAVNITNTNTSDPPACIYQAITCVVGHTYVVTTSKIGGVSDSFVTNITTGVSTAGGSGGFGSVIHFPNSGEQGTLTGTFTAAQTNYYIFLRLNTNAICTAVVTNIGVYNITAGTSLVAIGGGGGGGGSSVGSTGGSGGGMGRNYSAGYGTAGAVSTQTSSGSSGFGNSGGVAGPSWTASNQGSGGGGGAGSAGTNGTVMRPNGGAGIPFAIIGNLEYYAGGGGGGTPNAAGDGGLGGLGGGANGMRETGVPIPASPNTGGGGGGAGTGDATPGSNGGSGVVVLRYRVPQVATFLDTGAWTCPVGVTSVQALIVAGGGGSGTTSNNYAGGSGGGGVVYSSSVAVTPGTTYSVVVGRGGFGVGTANLAWSSTTPGGQGQNSSFAGIVAFGGGGAGASSSSAATSGNGQSGGSGGGGTGPSGGSAGAGVYAQGNAGGASGGTSAGAGGGGGGAGQAGTAGSGSTGGNGGNGLAYSISGTATYYGGGGGGCSSTTQGIGGLGGGGTANIINGGPAPNGTPNTGGGAGGKNYDPVGQGGSGIVILRWYGA